MVTAWFAFAACTALVLWLGGADYGSRETSRMLAPILRFFFPDLSPGELVRVHQLLRKTAHVAEYALLGFLAFRAVRLTLDTVLARVVVLSLLLVVAVATTDETRQAFSLERTGSATDVMLDASGALAAVGLAAVYGRRRRVRRLARGVTRESGAAGA